MLKWWTAAPSARRNATSEAVIQMRGSVAFTLTPLNLNPHDWSNVAQPRRRPTYSIPSHVEGRKYAARRGSEYPFM